MSLCKTNLQNAEALIFSHNARFFLVGTSPIAYLTLKVKQSTQHMSLFTILQLLQQLRSGLIAERVPWT